MILVTGAAGFIGYHVTKHLLQNGQEVVGIDNLSDYYDPSLKQARLDLITQYFPSFRCIKANIEDDGVVAGIVEEQGVEKVVHLAAQAGVRYSITHPDEYVDSNIMGSLRVFEACKAGGVEHVVYASSSSVYGDTTPIPFSTDSRVDEPVSMYAATKRACELMAYVYHQQAGLNVTGLRFFTVYGPWGRPDMSPFLFTKALFEGSDIQLFNHGDHRRDFTFVDDIVEGVLRVLNHKYEDSQYGLYNIGRGEPVALEDYVTTLEELSGRKAKRVLLPKQPGDVDETFADITPLKRDFGYAPETSLRDGLSQFVDWYRDYYRVDT